MEQMTLLLFIDNLLGRKSGKCLWIPVYHTESAVDKALVVEVNEYFDYAFAACLVHGESGAVPITAGTQTAQLLKDDASVLIGPVPSVLKELLAGQVVLLDTLTGKLLNHLSLGSDRGMVGAWHPTCVLTLHTGTTHQNILNSVVQHVSHMEHTCYVWRWNNDCVGFTSIGFTGKKFVVKPVLIPFRFDLFWVVFAC